MQGLRFGASCKFRFGVEGGVEGGVLWGLEVRV